MNLGLPGLSAYYWEENGQQEVIALVEGDGLRRRCRTDDRCSYAMQFRKMQGDVRAIKDRLEMACNVQVGLVCSLGSRIFEIIIRKLDTAITNATTKAQRTYKVI